VTDFSPLANRSSGTLLLPSDDGFAAALGGFNTAVIHEPDAVYAPASAHDVAAAVRFAREQRVPLAVQNTGHGAVRPVRGGLMLVLGGLDALALDAAARTATVGGGVTWAPIVEAAAAHGLAPITGSAATVGVIGYLTGGGLGPLANSHGFSSDYLVSARVVTGTGEIVTASADENPELLWALRGGKGGLGIVVEATLRLVELPVLYGGAVFLDGAEAEQILTGWLDWRAGADERITTSALVARFPDVEQVPPPLRGRHAVALRFAFPGSVGEGERLAAPLRALGTVLLDGLGELPPEQIARVHNDPTEPGPGWGFGLSVRDADAQFVRTFLRFFGPEADLPLIGAEIRLPGGAVRTDVPEGSAAGWRDISTLIHVLGAPDPSLFETVLPGIEQQIVAALSAWRSDHSTINWLEDASEPEQYAAAWPAETRRRLEAVRATYDPDGLFRYGPPPATA
jgi:FAD/FMN-containing dehydrogenase